MSARDSESGSSTYKGGSGRAGGLGNGGIGGGRGGGGNYGGGMGGGAGRNGGIGNRTGLTTGKNMFGGVAWGRAGGKAENPGAWGVRPQPAVKQGALNRPAGLLGNPVPAAVPGVNPVPEYVPQLPDMYYPAYTTPETVPGVPSPTPIGTIPSIPPNTNLQRFNGQNFLNTWNKQHPLANDLTRFKNNNRPAIDFRGMIGGFGAPGYNTSRSPGYGGRINGRGYGGWNTPGFN